MAQRLTLEQQAAERAEKEGNPAVLVSGVKCPCGNENKFRRDPFWLFSQDQVEIRCRRCGAVNILRFVPETASRRRG